MTRSTERLMATRWSALPRKFFRRPADEVAPELLGRYLVRELGNQRVVLRLVEVEAYLGRDDPASHAFRGPTRRNASMFLDGGHAYVYLVYGMHHCLNVVCGVRGVPHAVLLRAGEVVEGEAAAAARRNLFGSPRPRALAGGPGKLCAAMGIDLALDGASLLGGALRLTRGTPCGAAEIRRGPRVGVDYAGEAAHWPLRFGVAGSAALSRPLPP